MGDGGEGGLFALFNTHLTTVHLGPCNKLVIYNRITTGEFTAKAPDILIWPIDIWTLIQWAKEKIPSLKINSNKSVGYSCHNTQMDLNEHSYCRMGQDVHCTSRRHFLFSICSLIPLCPKCEERVVNRPYLGGKPKPPNSIGAADRILRTPSPIFCLCLIDGLNGMGWGGFLVEPPHIPTLPTPNYPLPSCIYLPFIPTLALPFFLSKGPLVYLWSLRW